MKTKVWPTRFSEELLKRMDGAASKLGLNRTDVIRICLMSWLEWFETEGHKLTQIDYRRILERFDGRTRAARQVTANEDTLAGEDPAVAEAATSLALVAMRKVLAEARERRKGKAASTSVGKAPPSGGFGTG